MGFLHVIWIGSSLVVHLSQIYREGEGRVTIFASQSISGTFDYVVREMFSGNRHERLIVKIIQAGDIGESVPFLNC